MLTLPEGGVLRLLREDPDEEEEDPPPPPSPPAPAAAPVGVRGTTGLGLERLEAALPIPAGDVLAGEGDGRVSNNRPMSAAFHCSKASSMSPWFPLSRISRRMLGDTNLGEPRLEADDPTPAGFTGVEGCEGRRDPSSSATLVVPRSKLSH